MAERDRNCQLPQGSAAMNSVLLTIMLLMGAVIVAGCATLIKPVSTVWPAPNETNPAAARHNEKGIQAYGESNGIAPNDNSMLPLRAHRHLSRRTTTSAWPCTGWEPCGKEMHIL